MRKIIKRNLTLGFFFIIFSLGIVINPENLLQTNIQSLQHDTHDVKNAKIDPQITALLQDPTNYDKYISIIAVVNPSFYQYMLNYFNQRPKYSIRTYYQTLSMLEITCCVKDIIPLESLFGLEAINLNLPKNIDKQSQSIPLQSSTGLITNYSQIIDTDSLGQTVGKTTDPKGKGVVIAVLDSGIDVTGQLGGDLDDFDDNMSTPDIKLYGSVSMVPYEPTYYSDLRGSGTYHAGVAAGTGGRNSSFVGVAPMSYILNVKVIDSIGLTYYSFVLSGLEWAIGHDADIICMPWVFPGYYNDPICLAINQIVDRGVIVVVPAGDDGPAYTSLLTPAQSEKSICVGAYDSISQSIASFQSRGPTYDLRLGVDIVAPAVNIVGPRVKLIPNTNISSTGSEFSIPDFSFGLPIYGTPVDENYTIVSSTTSACAIVAGVCALLVSIFPMANPEMIKMALMKSASPITSELGNEGYGLINVTAAAILLNKYLTSDYEIGIRIPQTVLYPGVVASVDWRNITNSPNCPEDWDSSNIYAPTSTQAMMTALMSINGTNMSNPNAMDLHLPLNQFAVEFNSTYLMFSELEVYRELGNVTPYSGFDKSDYCRFAGILGWEEKLLIAVIIETWGYTFSGNINPLLPNYTARMTGFEFSFHFLPIDGYSFTNLTLHSLFKADLYLNEYGGTDPNNYTQALQASLDDSVIMNLSRQMIYVQDCFNNSINATNETTVFGFQSLTHQLSSWEINTTDVLFQYFANRENNFSNSSHLGAMDPQNNPADYGFIQSWKIAPLISTQNPANFSGVFSMGKGNSSSKAIDRMFNVVDSIITNVTHPSINDMAIIRMKSDRMSPVNSPYVSSVQIINLGNLFINTTELWFIANDSSNPYAIVLFTSIFMIKNWAPMQVLQYSAVWTPNQIGVYSLGWILGGYSFLWLNDDNLFNNYQSRVIMIYSYEHLAPYLSELLICTPMRFPFAPFIVQYPGDISAVNLTIFTPLQLNSLDYELKSTGGITIQLNVTDPPTPSVQNHYAIITLTLNVPMFYKKGVYLLNIGININNHQGNTTLPIQFQLEDPHGRIMFDGIHNEFVPSIQTGISNFTLSGFQLTTLLQERVDTIYGDFYTFHKSLGALLPKGMSMTQIIPGIEFNSFQTDSISGISQGLDGNKSSFALDMLFNGDNFYNFAPNMTTDKYTYDLIKFFDALVIVDPEIAFTPDEIANLTKYMELGGIIFMFCENASEDDVTSINFILQCGKMKLGSQTFGDISVTPASSWPQSLRNSVSDISFEDPISILPLDGYANQVKKLENCDFIAYNSVGLGKLVAIGDEYFISERGLNSADNYQFIQNLFTYLLDVRFDFQLTLSNTTITRGERLYIEMNLKNQQYIPFLSSDFLAISGFTNEQGERINASLFGIEFPVMPMLPTNQSAFYGYFDSLWSEENATCTINLWIDSPYGLSEVISYEIKIIGMYPQLPFEIPDQRSSTYHPIFDFIFIALGIAHFLVLWQYSSEKWRSRHSFVPLTEERKARISTSFSSIDILMEQLKSAIQADNIEEIEKIRYILENEPSLKQTFKEFRLLASELGEK